MIAARWNAFIKRNRIAADTDLGEVIKSRREFFIPIIESTKKSFDGYRKAGRGWQI